MLLQTCAKIKPDKAFSFKWASIGILPLTDNRNTSFSHAKVRTAIRDVFEGRHKATPGFQRLISSEQ